MPLGLELVPEEGVGGPDTVSAGQQEVGGGAVWGVAETRVHPLLPEN